MIIDELSTAEGFYSVQTRKYVGSIYMPKFNIDITELSYDIRKESNASVRVQLVSKHDEDVEIYINETATQESEVFYALGNLFGSIPVDAFTGIDKNNLGLYSNGLSLFDALKLMPKGTNFFSYDALYQAYTWLPTDESALYLLFDSEKPFLFVEYTFFAKEYLN